MYTAQTNVNDVCSSFAVILPKHVIFIGEDKALLRDRSALLSTDFTGDDVTIKPTVFSPSVSITNAVSEEDDEDEFHRAGIWRILGIASELTDNALVITIQWLHSRSTLYYYLLEKLEVLQLEKSQGLQHVPASLSDEPCPVTVSGEASEENKDVERQTLSPTDDSISTTALSTDGIEHDHIVFYNKEKVCQNLTRISQRPLELLQALYHAVLANTDYICYLLIVINVMMNGSVLSLIYAALMFLWGLLSFPWPTKRFWLTLTFYTMVVILVKYGFQFQQIDWNGSPDAGLYWPHVLGIENKNKFFGTVVWDILLLIFLFVHRGLLHVSHNMFVGTFKFNLC